MSLHPWPDRPACVLDVPEDPDAWGWLTYLPPDGTRRTSLPVSRGPSRTVEVRTTSGGPHRQPVWHIETPEPGMAVTTPSIKVSTSRPDAAGQIRDVELYHSPYRVVWRVVDDLDDVA